MNPKDYIEVNPDSIQFQNNVILLSSLFIIQKIKIPYVDLTIYKKGENLLINNIMTIISVTTNTYKKLSLFTEFKNLNEYV